MFKIIGMELVNNEYSLNVLIEIDMNNISNLGIIPKLQKIIFNKDCTEITINDNKQKIDNNVEKNDNYFNNLLNKNKKLVIGMMLGMSLLSTNVELQANDQIQVSNKSSINIEQSNMLNNLKNNIIDDYFNDYKIEISKFHNGKNIDEIKELAKNTMFLNITPESDIYQNFSYHIDHKKRTDKYVNEQKAAIKNFFLEKNFIGEINDENIIKNKGFISINVSEKLLQKLEENKNNKDYVDDFNTYLKNVIYHEETHGIFHGILLGNEVAAVSTQKFKFKTQEFINDLKNDDNDTPNLKVYQTFLYSVLKSDVTQYNNFDVSDFDELKKANQNVYNVLANVNNFKKYILNPEAIESMNYYTHSTRINDNNNYYFNNNEYMSVILKDQFLDKEDIGFFDENDIRDEIKDKFSSSTFSGGIYANMLIFADEQNLSNMEIDLLKKYISTHILDSLKDNQLSGINHKETLIVYDLIQDKINDLYDITHEKYLSKNKDLESLSQSENKFNSFNDIN